MRLHIFTTFIADTKCSYISVQPAGNLVHALVVFVRLNRKHSSEAQINGKGTEIDAVEYGA